MSNIRRKLIMQQEENLLPPEYTAVNYIESFHGQYQYLDIDYIPDIISEEYETTISGAWVQNTPGYPNDKNEYVFGCGELWSFVHIGMTIWPSGYAVRIRKTSTGNMDAVINIPTNTNNIYTHKISSDGYKIFDTTTSQLLGSATYSSPVYTGYYDQSLYVFAWHTRIGNHTVMKLYNFVIRNKTTKQELCHLVPCVRKSDNKPGVYDTVRNRFFVNMNNNGYDFSYN